MPDSATDTELGYVHGLGIDAGGTRTRWALAGPDGAIVAAGHVGGLSALQMSSDEGRQALRGELVRLAAAVLPHGRVGRVRAGVTGLDGGGEQIAALLAQLLAIAPGAVSVCSDIEVAYAACLEPGQGYLVYAGTGSVGAWIDANGALHRAGGRGAALDDGGGGYWIAREALRAIWRAEDECPGRWRASPMAQAVFAQVGGSDWCHSRQFVYGQERGAVGALAVAVASAADTDPTAADILRGAGRELARLASALITRHGPRPVVLAGRAASLHPMILGAMRRSLPPGSALSHSTALAHVAAARHAARGAGKWREHALVHGLDGVVHG